MYVHVRTPAVWACTRGSEVGGGQGACCLRLREAQTWVVVEFSEVAEGTEITLTHCGFLQGEDWDQCRTYFQQAWRRVLRRLVSHWSRDVDLRTPHAVAQQRQSVS